MSISIGFDPEFLLVDAQTGKPVPACGLFGGTKKEPKSFGDAAPKATKKYGGYTYHEDNVALELGVPWAPDGRTAAERLGVGKHLIQTLAASKGLTLYPYGEVDFPSSSLKSDEAHDFGCDPDFDAYTGGIQRTNIPEFKNTRFGGGHIHIGGNFNCPQFVAALFLELGLARFMKGVPVAPKSGSKARAERRHYFATEPRSIWYGAPGIFRPKPYGIEYRTPSSAWLLGTRRTRQTVCRMVGDIAAWLEYTPASMLKKVSEQINWLTVREYVAAAPGRCSSTKRQAFVQELHKARRAEFPVAP